MLRKFLLITALIIISVVPSYSEDLIDSSKLNMRPIDDLNMGNMLPHYAGTGSFARNENNNYDLSRMKQMNPDFTTYPEAQGIIWLKHVEFSRSQDGGMEVTRLYVILGRHGLDSRWLNWNIPIPENGSIEVTEANVYDFNTLAKISSIPVEDDLSEGIKQVRFMGLPETFIISLSWREVLPEQLNIEGIIWFQEELRVWEATAEIHSPQKLSCKTFPNPQNPETENLEAETVYSWRRINIDPYDDEGAMARTQRAGAVFSSKQGKDYANMKLSGMLKEIENSGNITAPSDAVSNFKRSDEAGTLRLIQWLVSQPEIILAEGTPRKIPSSGALTKREKLLLAKSWLTSRKIDASLCWRLPFEPDEMSPMCPAMFYAPILNVQNIRDVEFHDMEDPLLITGIKIFSLNNDGKLTARRIPSSKSAENRLSAIMDLKLSDFGMMSGTIRIIPRGAWGPFLLSSKPSEGKAIGAVLSLFPGLTNYKDVKYKTVKGVPEISFRLENKPGIGGTGRGVLAILPFFEPVFVRRLGIYDPPVEIRFPFIIEQNITLAFPKNASEALVSGKTAKNPDKINYSDNYQNRRHRLEAEARFELNMQSVSSGNMTLLRRCLENWRVFSSRHIPVR